MGLRRELLARLLVAGIAAFLVIAGSVAWPLALDRGGEGAATNLSEYDPARLVPERADATGNVSMDRGNVSMDRGTERGTVLIDRAHGNRFTMDEIEPLTSAIAAAGYEVEIQESSTGLDEALSEADAFVVIDPASRYTRAQADRVEMFVENGGRLLLAGEPTRSTVAVGLFGSQIGTIRNRLDTLAGRFGIDFGEGYLFNLRENDGNFQNVFARPSTSSDLTAGIERVATYTATHVDAAGGERLLVSVRGTRNVRGDAPGTYSLGVRRGEVLALGDTTFLKRGNYQVVDNERLIGNLARFLTGGERRHTILDYPGLVDADPTIRYTDLDLLDAAQAIGRDSIDRGERPRLVLDRTAANASRADVLLTDFADLSNVTVETGIEVRDGRVEVDGYASSTERLVLVHAPRDASELDLVVAASNAFDAERAADLVVNGELYPYAISNSTAVIRLDS